MIKRSTCIEHGQASMRVRVCVERGVGGRGGKKEGERGRTSKRKEDTKNKKVMEGKKM